MPRQELSRQEFDVGMAHLERFFRKKLQVFDRDVYFDAVRRAPPERWEKVVRYACMTPKVRSLPMPGQLMEWMGIPEEISPAEEAHGFKAGTIRGVTPAELCDRVVRGDPLPFDDDCWADEVERTLYLDEPYREPPPEDLSLPERLAWIRRYAEHADAEYRKVKAAEAQRREEQSCAVASPPPEVSGQP